MWAPQGIRWEREKCFTDDTFTKFIDRTTKWALGDGLHEAGSQRGGLQEVGSRRLAPQGSRRGREKGQGQHTLKFLRIS